MRRLKREPVCGGFQNLPQGGQSCRWFSASTPSWFLWFAVFYLAVVPEKGQIVYRGLDPQNDTHENDSRLCRARHERDHAEFRIMPSSLLLLVSQHDLTGSPWLPHSA